MVARLILICLPLLYVLFVGLLYLDRWRAKGKVASRGASAPDVQIAGPLGLGFFYQSIKTWRAHRCLEWWEEIFARNGAAANGSYTAETYVMGGSRFIITAEPENVKAMLATDFASWGKGKDLYNAFKHFLGDSVLSTDGEKWHAARAVMRPLFMKERVTELDLFERNVQRLMPMLGNGEILEVDDIVFRYTLDAISEFLLGEGFGTLTDETNHLTNAFDVVQKTQSVIMRAGPLMWMIPRKKYNAGIKVIESYIEPSIKRATSFAASGDVKYDKSVELGRNTLLHALASYTTSPKVIRDQLVSVLFAGSDTTASALTWVIFELSRNPRVVSKLQGLITSTLGTSDPDRIPTFTELKSMKYLYNMINETLRLYAIMPFATRQALRDTTLPRGGGPDGQSPIAVLKDTPVLYSALLMHRRRDLYPPVSETFADPRVWSPERWDVWQPKSWQLIPFSGGARICLGQNFALAEIAYTVVRLLQNFEHIDDHNPRGKEDPILRYGIVATAEEGVKVAFVRKTDSAAALA